MLLWRRAVRGEPAPSEWNWYRYQVTRALHVADLVFASAPDRCQLFGFSVLGSGLSGCALVLGDIPSLRGIWNDAARLDSPNDRRALKAALQELIADPKAMENFADRARFRALEFTPQRMATGDLSAYSEVMTTRVPDGFETMCKVE